MLKLALCDDDAEQRSELSALLQKYLALPENQETSLTIFSSGYELLSAVEDTQGFDIYLLDIAMPELSGIELGKMLRSLSNTGIIIYLSVSPEYALDSYQAQALDYLLKPVTAEKLYAALARAITMREKQKNANIMVKTKDGWQQLRKDAIMYVELIKRCANYHMLNEELVTSTTLRVSFKDALADLLQKPNFCLCSTGFIINLYYVTAVEKGFLRLDDGTRIPLARSLAAEVKQSWSNYWLEEAKKDNP